MHFMINSLAKVVGSGTSSHLCPKLSCALHFDTYIIAVPYSNKCDVVDDIAELKDSSPFHNVLKR